MSNMNTERKYCIEFVRDNLTTSDLFLSLSEEASELASAAAKQARILIGNNPTPVSEKEGEQNVIEEFSDVCLCFEVLFGSCDTEKVEQTKNRKLTRWVSRLSDGNNIVVNSMSSNNRQSTGTTDATSEEVFVGDVLFGSTDNKRWRVVGTNSELAPYSLLVQDKNGTTKNVKPKWMAHNPWSFEAPATLVGVRTASNPTCYVFGTFSSVTFVSYNKDVACVRCHSSNSCDVVPLSSLSVLYWDNYNKILDDMFKYRDTPKEYCKKFTLSKLDVCDARNSMLKHLTKRLQSVQ